MLTSDWSSHRQVVFFTALMKRTPTFPSVIIKPLNPSVHFILTKIRQKGSKQNSIHILTALTTGNGKYINLRADALKSWGLCFSKMSQYLGENFLRFQLSTNLLNLEEILMKTEKRCESWTGFYHVTCCLSVWMNVLVSLWKTHFHHIFFLSIQFLTELVWCPFLFVIFF